MVGMILGRYARSRGAYVFILMLSAACMYVSYMGIYRVMDRFQFLGVDFRERMEFTRNTYEMGQAFPLTGTGLGTFEFVYPVFQKNLFDVSVDYAHNDWVQLFAETGWPGLILVGGGFLCLLTASLSRWRRRRDPFSVGIGLGGMGALVGMAVHSLADYNLHMPANALVLALILAITHLALSSKISRGEEHFSWARWKIRPAPWMAMSLAVLVTLGGTVMAKEVLWTWRADSMARVFENSTLPSVDPTDAELKEACSLAPGNAAYWTWLGMRKNAEKVQSKAVVQGNLESKENPDRVTESSPQGFMGKRGGFSIRNNDEAINYFADAIKRNPTGWTAWREMAWSAFHKAEAEPDYYFMLAVKAIGNARKFRPYDPQQQFEDGVVTLVAESGKYRKTVNSQTATQFREYGDWRGAFKDTLRSRPDWAHRVVDRLILYLGDRGVKEVRALLPDDSSAFVLAASTLGKGGFPERGLEVLREGEIKRQKEIEALWKTYSGDNGAPGLRVNGSGKNLQAILMGGNSQGDEPEKLLVRILDLDPQHPGGMLAKGKIIEAVKCQDQRGGRLGQLGDLKRISSALSFLEQEKQGSPVDIAYFRAKISIEEGMPGEAGARLQQALKLNPQYFPAWVQVLKLMEKKAWAGADGAEMESLQRKVELFQMDRVVADAWQWGGEFAGSPSWVAPVRNAHDRSRLTVHFAGSEPGLWKLTVDGRFAAAWAGSSGKETAEFELPAGEHLFRVIWHKDPPREFNKKVPGKIQIEFSESH
jgi:tetratricopeptide (TPR) repeat protein